MARARGGRPVVIKRVNESGHVGHHGGAWKVAYADFVTAMMAFFLLLWLISSANKATLRGLAQYFTDARVNTGIPNGNGEILSGRTLLPEPDPPAIVGSPAILPPSAASADSMDGEPFSPDGPTDVTARMTDAAFEAEQERRERAAFGQAREAIARALEDKPDLRKFADNLMIEQTPEGLRIQIVDRANSPMFPLGSDQMFPHTRELLDVVVRSIATLPNKVSIRGHTDARPYPPGGGYDNWRLSSDRANAARRVMVELGLRPDRVADVRGKADSENLVPDNPTDPTNRRLSLVLLHAPAAPGEVRAGGGGASVAAEPPDPLPPMPIPPIR